MKKRILLLIASTILVANTVFGRDILIVSGHPEYPPIMWLENNTIVGVAAELAKTIFTAVEVPFEIKYTGPWPRVQQNAKTGDIDMIVAAYVNSERQTYMDYTIPFMKDPVSVFVWKGKAFPFNGWEDLIGKKGSTVRGESYGKKFDQFIEQKLRMQIITNTIQNFKLLEIGRVDYAIIGLYPGLSHMYITGFDDRIEVLPHPILTENFYMTFSKKSKFKHLLPKVNRIIQRLRDEGTIEKWVKKYQEYYYKTNKRN